MSVENNGQFGFLILIADIFAIVNVLRSGTPADAAA